MYGLCKTSLRMANLQKFIIGSKQGLYLCAVHLIAKLFQQDYNILKSMPKAFVLLALISTLILLGTATNPSPNVTFAPPPPITSTTLFSFQDSPADGRPIVSSRLQTLSIRQFVVGIMTFRSNFTLRAFDRSVPGNIRESKLTLNGAWSHVESSSDTLSCSVVYESSNQLLGLLRYNRTAQSLNMLLTIPLQNLFQFRVTLDLIRQAIIVGQECRVLSFTNFATGQTSIYRPTADYSSFSVVHTPANWEVAAATEDLMYGISNNILFSYNQKLGQYEQIYSFPSTQKYWIKSSGGRILVGRFNFRVIDNTDPNNPIFSINITVTALNHRASGVVKIGDVVVNGAIQYREPDIFASPQLTKFGFGYRKSLQSPTTIVSRDVDFTKDKMFEITWEDADSYFQRIQNINGRTELDFNDYFIAFRNSSNFRTTDPKKAPFEMAYQFNGTKATFLRERNLFGSSTFDNSTNTTGDAQADRQIFSFLKLLVDWTITDRLVVIDVYLASPGNYDVIGWDYGSLSSNRKIESLPTPSIPGSVGTRNLLENEKN